MPFGIRHPPPTHQLQSTCVGEGSRVPNLQMEFNYLDSFKSYGIFDDFVVPTWSPSSSRHPCHRHISPRHPHVVPIAPRRSHVVSMVCGLHMLSLSSPHHPRHPMSSSRPHHPHVVPIAPRRSPCGLHGLWSPHVVPVIPVVPMSSPHHLEGPHIIPNPPKYPVH